MSILFVLGLLVGVVAGEALEKPLQVAGGNAAEIRGFVESAGETHGEAAERAALFLVEGMSPADLQQLDQELLTENLDLAFKARASFPWAKSVPEEVFFNDVLPYASLDETRERWRKSFYDQNKKLVADCKTTTEAAQAINKEFFKVINVHYNTGRKRPNQSPAESIKQGRATCTGLSIILVDACRSVGVPARVAGTFQWAGKRGNHTWVEIWDEGQWFYLGADEYDDKGLNRGWFTGDASNALANDWKHAIWATSWRKTDAHFPMVWNFRNKDVAGVNVTARYSKLGSSKEKSQSNGTTVYFRVFNKQGGKRIAVSLEVFDSSGKSLGSVKTNAGHADLNDMPQLELEKNQKYTVQLLRGSNARMTVLETRESTKLTVQWNWPELHKVSKVAEPAAKIEGSPEPVRRWLKLSPEERKVNVPGVELSKAVAGETVNLIFQQLRADEQAVRQQEIENKIIKAAGKELKYMEKTFGDAEDGKKSLWISMHGGGGAPKRVNDQQWQNQIRLYSPEEGIVIAPRAPTDTWNLWHEGHIDDLFDRLIENYVLLRGVDPNRIFLMGYSAGGDGVYQLAPRMADRFAAASMMAGHPNDASPLGLRNLPFMIFMGGKDGAYKRNQVAAEWKVKLADLQQADPEGYTHKVTIYPDFGHWMNGEDRAALPWMFSRTRNAWPKKIVWHQSNRTHDRFYWLAVPAGTAKGGQTITAEIKGQEIVIQTSDELHQLTLRLSDQLLNLDEPIQVTVNGKEIFSGKVKRSVQAIWNSLGERLDPESVATSTLDLKW